MGQWTRKAVRRLRYIAAAVLAAAALFYGACWVLSWKAADIFNETAAERDLFPGTVTVSRITADLWGRVYARNLRWTSGNGQVLADIPDLQISLKPWDVLTGHIGTMSVTEVRMNGAYVHLFFDDRMRLQAIKPAGAKGKKGEPLQLTGALGNRPFQCALFFQNGTIEVEAPRRHFKMSGVDIKARADTKQYIDVDILTGPFAGTIEAEKLVLKGRVDFTKEEPQYCMTMAVTGCNPSSLDAGIGISDPASAYADIHGDLRRPVIDGTLEMAALTMPALHFKNVQGHLHYEGGLLAASAVTADVFGGKVEGEGTLNLDTKAYESHLRGQGLQGGIAARDWRLRCDVDLDLHIAAAGQGAPQQVWGSFLSGSGRWHFLPFEKISGSFDKRGGTLQFHDVVISLAMGDVMTDALSIHRGHVTLGPVYLTDALTGKTTQVH